MMNATTAKEQFDLNFVELNALVEAVPRTWVINAKQGETPIGNVKLERLITPKTNISRVVYQELTTDYSALTQKANLWNVDLNLDMSIDDFLKHFTRLFVTTNIPKLRSFQFRILHRAIVLNSHLFHWKIRNDNMCSFCDSAKETLMHFFVECPQVEIMWSQLSDYISQHSGKSIQVTKATILLNTVDKNASNIANFLALLLKQYLYRQRCGKKRLQFKEFIAYVKEVEHTEKYIAIKNNKLSKHAKKWQNFS